MSMTPNDGPFKGDFSMNQDGPLMPKIYRKLPWAWKTFYQEFFVLSYFCGVCRFLLNSKFKILARNPPKCKSNIPPFSSLHISNRQLINASQKLRVQGIFDIFTASREWLALEGIFWSTTDLLSSCHCYVTWYVLVDWVDRGIMYLYKFMGYIHESYEQAIINMRICSSLCTNYWGATTKKEFRLRGV